MKDFSDLRLIGNSSELEKLIELIEQNLCDGWTRGKDNEIKLQNCSKVDYQIFTCSRTNLRRSAALFLTFDNNKYLYVCNIVPNEKGTSDLGIDGYNSILREFQTKFIEPIAKDLEIRVIVTPPELNIDNVMSSQLVANFRQFSDAANKASGGTHPNDEKRFFDFVIQAHTEKSLLDESTLRKLLIDEEWSEDHAYNLSIKYDFGRDLLKHYEPQ